MDRAKAEKGFEFEKVLLPLIFKTEKYFPFSCFKMLLTRINVKMGKKRSEVGQVPPEPASSAVLSCLWPWGHSQLELQSSSLGLPLRALLSPRPRT